MQLHFLLQVPLLEAISGLPAKHASHPKRCNAGIPDGTKSALDFADCDVMQEPGLNLCVCVLTPIL